MSTDSRRSLQEALIFITRAEQIQEMLIDEHAKTKQDKRHVPESKQVFTQDQILEDQTILAYRLFTKGMIATNYFLLHLSSVTTTKRRNKIGR